ncbi:MAG TPA: hypothetical protein PK466_13515 [Thermotogota bacterium]|nr:hypothetical protein [Thermotogota bacterium]HPJ90250.1 hypothetical protein [Thermotogota bacterium]HPR97343.1 hypothetical protein [Thermotogota bacterium]
MSLYVEEREWKQFYKAAAISLFIFLGYSVLTMILMPIIGAQPETVRELFEMIENNRLTALIRLDFLTICVMPLYFIIYFAVYGILKKDKPVSSLFWMILLFSGTILFLATPSALSLIPLSDQYHTAVDPVVKNNMIAAAEALRASDMWHMTGAFVGSVMIQIASIGISFLMMRSSVFGRKLGIIGVITHTLDLIHFFFFIIDLEVLSTVFIGTAGILYLILYAWMAIQLLKVSKS